jgi:hypothetical protein
VRKNRTSIARQQINKHASLITEDAVSLGRCKVVIRKCSSVWKGSLESETVKYGIEFQGTRNRERLRWQGPAAYTKDRPVLSSERAPHKNKTVNVKQ